MFQFAVSTNWAMHVTLKVLKSVPVAPSHIASSFLMFATLKASISDVKSAMAVNVVHS